METTTLKSEGQWARTRFEAGIPQTFTFNRRGWFRVESYKNPKTADGMDGYPAAVMTFKCGAKNAKNQGVHGGHIDVLADGPTVVQITASVDTSADIVLHKSQDPKPAGKTGRIAPTTTKK